MQNSDLAQRRRGWFSPRLFLLLLAVLPTGCGVWLALPRLGFWLWHDEIYTLQCFATGRLRDALLDYHLPNNHILFSAVFGQLRELLGLQLLDILPMRLLMLLSFAAMLLLAFLLTRRIAGNWAAAMLAMLLATSHPILAYAIQIRGYGPSCILTLTALWALWHLREAGCARRWLIVYVASGFVSVGILPTNLCVFAVLAAWFALWQVQAGGWGVLRGRALWRRLSFVALTPLSGLAFLLPVYGQVAQSLQGGAVTPLPELLVVWPWAALRDFWWLLPVAALPLLRRETRREGALYLALLASALAVPLLCAGVLSSPPNSRVFYPVLPLVYAALAWGVWLGARTLLRGRAIALAAGAVLLLLPALGYWRESNGAWYFERYPRDAYIHDLYDHTYQYDYRIVETIQQTQRLGAAAPPSFVVIGDCDPMCVFWYCRLLYGEEGIAGMPMVWYGMFAEREQTRERFKRLYQKRQNGFVIARSAEEAARAVKDITLPAQPLLSNVGDFGVFQLFRLYPPAGR